MRGQSDSTGGQHGFNAIAYTQTGPPGRSTGLGAEYDIYDWLVGNGIAGRV